MLQVFVYGLVLIQSSEKAGAEEQGDEHYHDTDQNMILRASGEEIEEKTEEKNGSGHDGGAHKLLPAEAAP